MAPVATFSATRPHLEERKVGGLHGGMRFTCRNPARSTHPAQPLPGALAEWAALGLARSDAVGTAPAVS